MHTLSLSAPFSNLEYKRLKSFGNFQGQTSTKIGLRGKGGREKNEEKGFIPSFPLLTIRNKLEVISQNPPLPWPVATLQKS